MWNGIKHRNDEHDIVIIYSYDSKNRTDIRIHGFVNMELRVLHNRSIHTVALHIVIKR